MAQKKSQKEKAILMAEYFIKKNEKDQKGLDNKKIQKLLYYSQAWNLVFNNKGLFPNKIEAWVHGPAIPEVYRAFREFDFSRPHPEISEENFKIIAGKERKILDLVWRVYGKYDSNYLEALVHNELPWQEARKGLSVIEPSQNVISEKKMKEYYEQKLKEAKKGSNQKSKS